jgi:hypothetical protein
MNKDLKDRWIAALRGGEFKQVRGTLFSTANGKYCCLGVLGCVYNGTEGLLGAFGNMEDGIGGYEIAEREIGVEGTELLQKMNDGDSNNNFKQHSFDEIADYIETNF